MRVVFLSKRNRENAEASRVCLARLGMARELAAESLASFSSSGHDCDFFEMNQ